MRGRELSEPMEKWRLMGMGMGEIVTVNMGSLWMGEDIERDVIEVDVEEGYAPRRWKIQGMGISFAVRILKGPHIGYQEYVWVAEITRGKVH